MFRKEKFLFQTIEKVTTKYERNAKRERKTSAGLEGHSHGADK